MLDLRRVRVFYEVARRGSFSEAAHALHYTQPAVSHHVSKLEEEVGAALINRASKPWRLTEAGERLYEHAEVALAELSIAEDELIARAGGERGQIRVASVLSGLRSVVPFALAGFRERFPKVQVVLTESQPALISRGVRAGEFDLGISIATASDDPSLSRSLDVRELLGQRMMVVLSADDELAGRDHLTLRSLRKRRWILPSARRVPEFRREVDALLVAAGYEPDVALDLTDDVAGVSLVAEHVGITLLPSLAIVPSDRIVRIPLRPERKRALCLITRAGLEEEPVSRFAEELVRVASDWPHKSG